jgi:hypothetical protein
VLVARDGDEFVAHLQQALHLRGDPLYLGALQATAREHTWEARARTILTALDAKRLADDPFTFSFEETSAC